MPTPGQNCGGCYFALNQQQVQDSGVVTVLACHFDAPQSNVPPLKLGTDILPARWPQVDPTDGWCGYWSGEVVPPGRNCGNCYFLQNQTQVQDSQVVTVPTCRFTVPRQNVPPLKLGTDLLPARWPQVDPVNDWCGQWISSSAPRGPTWRQPANVFKAVASFYDFTGNGNPVNAGASAYQAGLLNGSTFSSGDEYIFGASAAQVGIAPFTALWKYTNQPQPVPPQIGLPVGNWTLLIWATPGTGAAGGGGTGDGGGGGGDGGGDD